MFGEKEVVYFNEKIVSTLTKLAIEEFAINSAINLISGCVSKCEFKTYWNDKEIKGDEYYMWNVEPNINQNSTEFIQEIISKLLLKNECLVIEVNNQLIIADSFNQEQFAIKENYFESVRVKDFTFDKRFYMRDVLYFRLNNRDITRLLSRLMDGYTNLLNMAVGKYRRSGGRKGIVRLDKVLAGDEEQKRKIEELFSRKFKTYFEAENAVLDLPRNVEYDEKNGDGNRKSTSEIVDIQNLINAAFERSAQAYKIPPALLKGEIADVDKITKNFLTFAIDPLVDLVAEEINRKRYGKINFLKGSKVEIDTTCIMHIDVFSIAEKVDKLIASGMYSIDDLLIKVGDRAKNTEWSKKHWITKNYQDINDLEGGENNE